MQRAIVESLLAREQREDPKDDDRANNGSDDFTQAAAAGIDAQQVEQPATYYTTKCTDDEVDDTALVCIAANSASNVTGKNADNDGIKKIHIQ